MKQLHSRVNIVPVIGKADTLTPKELRELKKKVTIKLYIINITDCCNSVLFNQLQLPFDIFHFDDPLSSLIPSITLYNEHV